LSVPNSKAPLESPSLFLLC